VDPHRWTVASLLLFGLTVVAWGTNYLFVRVGLGETSPLWLAALRSSVGLAAFGAYYLALPPTGALDRLGKLHATLLGIPNTAAFFGLWFVAETTVPPGQAAVVIYTYPLWVAFLSVPLLRRPLAGEHWVFVALGFTGVLLVSEPWTGGASRASVVPLVELVGAAIAWALSTVLAQRRFRPEAMLAVNGYQLLGGAVVLVGAALVLDPGRWPSASVPLVVSVLWLGLLGTSFAYAVWFWLLGRVPAATLSAYAFLVPIVALGASALLFGERLGIGQAVGVLLVIASVYGIARVRSGSPTSTAVPD
jgi:drug/metabolite transporter (DMT)-like permease